MKKQKQTVTPGPWSTGGIADPYGPNPHTSVYGKAAPGASSGALVCRGMSIPDGNLIAAAPELLEALKLAQRWLANCAPVTEIDGPKPLPVIAAAIDKAEGREGIGFFDEEIVLVD